VKRTIFVPAVKLNRTYSFITILSIALIIVLVIQVNWILQSAKLKEEMFNEKANIILAKTAESISADKNTLSTLKIFAGPNEVHKIDSLLNYFMKYYNFQVAYYFEITPNIAPGYSAAGLTNYAQHSEQNCYTTCLGNSQDKNNLELKLVFPKKEQFILAEIGLPFITTVILILIVIILTSKTILSLQKEKLISDHTNEFLNNMTHEFKTPLTNIALAGKLILKNSIGPEEEKIKHYSCVILEENEKLRLQVEQVLSMTALERGEIPLRKTKVDVHELIMETLKSVNLQVENRNGEIFSALNAVHFFITADKTHLANALNNLIDNSLKYSVADPVITIKTFNENNNLVIMLSDKGPGIGSEYIDKVFLKYYRIPKGNLHDVKGFGLGLTYVKKIIDLHSGTIQLESEAGKGTTFTISLPYV
jgi:two-component system phosphate regulon sensor histidine kinase PhoR